MDNVNKLVSKVRQAPWRVQRQWIGLFLLGVVLMTMVAAIYLNVTVRTALAGREILVLQSAIDVNRLINADQETKLAGLTSAKAVQQRALALGFRPATSDQVVYVLVAGYTPPSTVDLSSSTEDGSETPILLPTYSESLFDWFTRKLAAPIQTGEQQQ
jgi:hypothetical protein